MAAGRLSPYPTILNPNQSERAEKSLSIDESNSGLADFPPLTESTSASQRNKELSIGVSSEIPNPGKWRSLFGSNKGSIMDSSSCKLEFLNCQSIEGKRTIISSTDIIDELRVCDKFVVGYFVGRKPPFNAVKEAMGKAWNLKGGFRMSLHEESMYIFEFDLVEDRVAALEVGSVTIFNKLFLIRPWQLFIEHNIQELKSVPVWMNLRKVPIHLWNAKGLSMIASDIGTPICSDKQSLERTRMSYARVCVEMEVTSDFPSFIPISFDGKELDISVEYTWKPPRCQACATFSHSSAKCPKVSASKVTKKIWVPKLSKTNKETLGRMEESQRLDLEEVNADLNINNVSETDIDKAGNLETPRNEEHNDSGSLKEKGESRVQSNEDIIDNVAHISIEENAESPDVEWKYVRRKNKGSSKENGKKIDELKNKNSFESLIEVNEDLPSVETVVSQSNNNDQHNEDAMYVDDCVESNEESEYETDNEETCVKKFKPIEEVSRRKSWTKEQHMDKLLRFSTMLGVPHGGKENIYEGIVDNYRSSRTDKELTRLSWNREISNELLGRGKRTPAKKKF